MAHGIRYHKEYIERINYYPSLTEIALEKITLKNGLNLEIAEFKDNSINRQCYYNNISISYSKNNQYEIILLESEKKQFMLELSIEGIRIEGESITQKIADEFKINYDEDGLKAVLSNILSRL